MKTRIILVLIVCAVATLSFTFGSIGSKKENTVPSNEQTPLAEPVGGMLSAEKL